MLNFLYENWIAIVIIIASCAIIGKCIYDFWKLPLEKKYSKVKEWLLYIVAEAERILGSGTGALKVKFVYNEFINTFPVISKFLSFDKFSKLVDVVLKEFNEILENNQAISDYIKKNE